ncbi:hypothetical protein IJG21_02845 [Candidatus Saccharibacteria bacterium]|nr:hypothetical protein [Candidatus Saccharibacteria bacterium]
MNPQNPFQSPPANPYRPVPTAPLSPPPSEKKPVKSGGHLKTVLLVFFIFISVAALALLGYVYFEYTDLKNNVDEKISLAVASAEKETTEKLEAAFTEREKSPYLNFSGPTDYGELSFQYPKTWSVYVAKDANKGGDFEAYLNPGEVSPVSDSTINALRVIISTKSIEKVQEAYEKLVSKGTLTAEIKTINNESSTVYSGTLPNKLVGAAAVIKLRDKTAIIETDAEIFLEDFNQILETITYNL